jgi:hypothetical protein
MKYEVLKWLLKHRGTIEKTMTVVVILAEGMKDLVRARRRPKKLK